MNKKIYLDSLPRKVIILTGLAVWVVKLSLNIKILKEHLK